MMRPIPAHVPSLLLALAVGLLGTPLQAQHQGGLENVKAARAARCEANSSQLESYLYRLRENFAVSDREKTAEVESVIRQIGNHVQALRDQEDTVRQVHQRSDYDLEMPAQERERLEKEYDELDEEWRDLQQRAFWRYDAQDVSLAALESYAALGHQLDDKRTERRVHEDAPDPQKEQMLALERQMSSLSERMRAARDKNTEAGRREAQQLNEQYEAVGRQWKELRYTDSPKYLKGLAIDNEIAELAARMGKLRDENRLEASEWDELSDAQKKKYTDLLDQAEVIEAEALILQDKKHAISEKLRVASPDRSPTILIEYPEYVFFRPEMRDTVVLDNCSELRFGWSFVTHPDKIGPHRARIDVLREGEPVYGWTQGATRTFDVVPAEGELIGFSGRRLELPPGPWELRITARGTRGKQVVGTRRVFFRGSYSLEPPAALPAEARSRLAAVQEEIARERERARNARKVADESWGKGEAWANAEAVVQTRLDAARRRGVQYRQLLLHHFGALPMEERLRVQDDLMEHALQMRIGRIWAAEHKRLYRRRLLIQLHWKWREDIRWIHRDTTWCERELELAREDLKGVAAVQVVDVQGKLVVRRELQLIRDGGGIEAALPDLREQRRMLVAARADAGVAALLANELVNEKVLDQQRHLAFGLIKQWEALKRAWSDEHAHSGALGELADYLVILANSGFALVDVAMATGSSFTIELCNALYGTNWRTRADKVNQQIDKLHDRNTRAIAYLRELRDLGAEQMLAANEVLINKANVLPPERYAQLSEILGASFSFAAQEELLADYRFFRATEGGLLRILGGICATGIEKRRQEYQIGLAGAKHELFHLRDNFFLRLGRDTKDGSLSWATVLSPGALLSQGMGVTLEHLMPGGRMERAAEIQVKSEEVASFTRLGQVLESHLEWDPSRLRSPKLRFARAQHHDLLSRNADYRDYHRRIRQLDYSAASWANLRRENQELARDEPSASILEALAFERRLVAAISRAEDLEHRRALLWLRLREHLMACDWNDALNTTRRMESLRMGDLAWFRGEIENLVTRDLGCEVLKGWADTLLLQKISEVGLGFVGLAGQSAAEQAVGEAARHARRAGTLGWLLRQPTFWTWWKVANPFAQGVEAAAQDLVENIAQECLTQEVLAQTRLGDEQAGMVSKALFDLAKGAVERIKRAPAELERLVLGEAGEDATDLRRQILEQAGDLDDHPLVGAARAVEEAARRVEAGAGGEAESELARSSGELVDLLRAVRGAGRCAELEQRVSRAVLGVDAGDAAADARKLREEIETLRKSTFDDLIVDYELRRYRDDVESAVRVYFGERRKIGDGPDAGLPAEASFAAALELVRRLDMKKVEALKSAGLLSVTYEKALDRARRTVTHALRAEIVERPEFRDLIRGVIITGTGGDPGNPEYKLLGSDQDFTYLVADGTEEGALKQAFDRRFEELTGRPPGDYAIECFQDPISKLDPDSREGLRHMFERLRGESGQGERYMVLGTLKVNRFTDMMVGCGYELRDGRLVRQSDEDYQRMFGRIEFVEGDGFDIFVDNIAFLNKYKEHYAGSPAELLAHTAKYDIRILVGLMTSTQEGRRRLNSLTRAEIREAGGFHAAIVEKSRGLPGLEFLDSAPARRYYDAAQALKLDRGIAVALDMPRKPGQSAADYKSALDAEAARLIDSGVQLRKAYPGLLADARLRYRAELKRRFDELDRIDASPEQRAAAAKIGQELAVRDLAAAFRAGKLTSAQKEAIGETGGPDGDAAQVLMEVSRMVLAEDRPLPPGGEARARPTCPVY
jgi:hypothetical protein